MRLINDRRGISPLIATIILISICVAGGLLIYSVFFSTSGTLTTKGELSVESIDLVKDTDGNVVFTITIKNSGNKPVDATKDVGYLKVTLDGENDYDLVVENILTSNLEPGQSVSAVLTNSEGGGLTKTYTVGDSYNVVIQAKFTDGSTFTTTTSVKCRSA